MTEIKLNKKEEKELFFKALFGSPVFTVVASVLATFIISAIFARVGGGVPINVTSTTTETVSTFDVTGEGKTVVTPDEAVVRFGLTDEGSDVSLVQERVNEKINGFKESVKDLGVEEKMIKTTGYNVRPRYDYSDGRSRIVGYTVSVNLEVRFKDFEGVNSALDLATVEGLNQVGGLQFTLSDEAEKEALKAARKEAIEEAGEKAHELAKLAGMNLGKVVNVQENASGGVSPYYPVMRDMMALDSTGEEPAELSSVEPGESEIVVSVTLSYKTL